MSYHNNDIAACEGKNCPMRTTCLRWQLGQTMEDYHWYISIYDPKYCEYYIHNDEPTNDNNNGKGN